MDGFYYSSFVIDLLTENVKKYANYLREVNKNMNVLHNSDFSVRNPDCDSKVYAVEASDNIHFKIQISRTLIFCLKKIITNSLILKNIHHTMQYRNIITSKICNSIFL